MILLVYFWLILVDMANLPKENTGLWYAPDSRHDVVINLKQKMLVIYVI